MSCAGWPSSRTRSRWSTSPGRACSTSAPRPRNRGGRSVEHYFGAHTVDNGGIHMAARRAANAGMRALQIFSAIPKYYNERVSVRPERAQRFRETIAASAIAPERIVVHAAYVLNTATPDETKWVRARDGLAKELERSTALGVGAVCFHPGAATDGDREAAAAPPRSGSPPPSSTRWRR